MSTEIKNAKIVSTMLGREDHGILTALITLDFSSFKQAFGGYALDTHDGKKRVGHEACGQFVMGVLEVVGVESWEDLKGKYVRVDMETGWNGKILRIGHITEDKWFDPKVDLNEQ